MKTKVKYIVITFIVIVSKAFSQNSDLLFSNDTIQIYKSSAFVMSDTIYDATADFEKIRNMEETDECKVDYSFFYNPLSLVGAYYSYEYGEGGTLACGVPGNSVGIRTIDLNTKKEISLTDIFEEKSILKALKSDKWVQRIGKEGKLDFSAYTSLIELLTAINRLNHAKFAPSGFAILKYSEEKNEVAVRFVGQAYMGYNHNQHLQLGLILIPKPNLKDRLLNETKFMLGEFDNGLTH